MKDAGPSKEALYLQSLIDPIKASGKMSYTAMAKAAGTTATMLYQWRDGRRPVPWEKAADLAK